MARKPKEPDALNEQQEKFCREYLKDFNATQAAIRAGYSEKTAQEQSSRLLSKVMVSNRINELNTKVLNKYEVTDEKIVAEYAKLAFSNMGDYITVHNDGYAYVDLSELTPEQAAALQEVQVDEYTEGHGEDSRDIKRVKIKLADKKGALDSLARRAGMFKDKVEHTHAFSGKELEDAIKRNGN